MKRVSLLGLSVLLAACAEPSAPVAADLRGPAMTVTLNGDGTGFVGKGDVQIAFGWSNAQLQQNAYGVTFSIVSQRKAYQDCAKQVATGPGGINVNTLDQTHQRQQQINATLNGDPRQTKGQKQFTGFNLTGYGSGGGWTGQDPTCPTGWTAVLRGSTDTVNDFLGTPGVDIYYGDETGGGLTATHNGISHVLPIT